jgi:hypothetical protein
LPHCVINFRGRCVSTPAFAEEDLYTTMKTLLILVSVAATLCLSACDTMGARSRSNNTGPGSVGGPAYTWYTPSKGTGHPPKDIKH